MPFSQFNLLHELHQGIKAMGFTSPTPIQLKAIPPALEGRDVIGSAQTGSGKTVAFVLPLLQRLLGEPRAHARPEVRALIIVPTRELAAQVETAVRDLSRYSSVRCALVIGGTSYHNQVEALRAGAEVVVATPGRLLDHWRSGTIKLNVVRVAVLDEADRMLDMGFIPDIRQIVRQLPRERQTLMFSATIPPIIERLIGEFMREPVRIEIDRPTSPAAGISQAIYPITVDQKIKLLLAIIQNSQVTSALIFTRTKDRADLVARFLLNAGIQAAVLHSNKTQAQRTQAMESFRQKERQILVATDLASRGIDVRHISHVINFDVPLHAEDYVHRIGRTGRAFTVGDAITLMSFDEVSAVAAIEGFIGQTIPRAALPGFPYRVPPLLTAYKQRAMDKFGRPRRSIPRASQRFRR